MNILWGLRGKHCQVFCNLLSFPCSIFKEFVVVSDKNIIEEIENHNPETGGKNKIVKVWKNEEQDVTITRLFMQLQYRWEDGWDSS